jgi:hypothetical protein
VTCGARDWILASDGFDERLTLIEVDRELRVVQSAEALNSGLPDRLSVGIDDPEYATSPAHLSCEGGELVISQVWVERKTQQGFGIETLHTNLATFRWDVTDEANPIGVTQHISEVTARAHQHTVRDGDQWVSLSVDDEGSLWLERWSVTRSADGSSSASTSGAVQLTAPDSRRRDAEVFSSRVSDQETISIGLINRFGELWVSSPAPLDLFSPPPIDDALVDPAPEPPLSWFRMRFISGLLESIREVTMSVDHERTVTLFNASMPSSALRALYLSVIDREAPVEGALRRVSTVSAATRSLWFQAERGAYTHLWSDSTKLWRATGAPPCP